MEVSVNSKADAWRLRIDNQRASGQSIRAWCEANHAQESSFYRWVPNPSTPFKPKSAKNLTWKRKRNRRKRLRWYLPDDETKTHPLSRLHHFLKLGQII
jgi:hypothetical protein